MRGIFLPWFMLAHRGSNSPNVKGPFAVCRVREGWVQVCAWTEAAPEVAHAAVSGAHSEVKE